MIFILLNFALCLIFLHFEYTAFIIIIIYIGAISVLFLFVIMLVNLVKNPKQTKDFVFLFWIFVLFIFFFFYVLSVYFSLGFNSNFEFLQLENTLKLIVDCFCSNDAFFVKFSSVFFSQSCMPLYLSNVEIEQLGFVLWTNYGCLILLSALILVISIVGSVAVLKSMFSSNLLKKKLLSLHARQNTTI